MLHMYFFFFNVEIIRGFTSTFVGICSYTSHLLGFLSRSKLPPLDFLKFLVNTLCNQDKKVALIQVDKDRALAISSEFMKKCPNTKIIVKISGETFDKSMVGPLRILVALARRKIGQDYSKSGIFDGRR